MRLFRLAHSVGMWGLIAGVASTGVAVQVDLPYEPPELLSGGLPVLPVQSIGWEHVLLEVHVGREGQVVGIRSLAGDATLDGRLREAVLRWEFEPAAQHGEPVEAYVSVTALFRPPTFLDDTPSPIPPPGTASIAVPVPQQLISPIYPPQAVGDAAVLVAVRVEPSGAVGDALVLQSAGAFDVSALDAVRQWRFEPVRTDRNRETWAYVVLGFREPVQLGPPSASEPNSPAAPVPF